MFVSLTLLLSFISLGFIFYQTVQTGYSHFRDIEYEFDSADAISLQITLLQVLIGSFALGVGALGIIGWKELRNTLKTSITKDILEELEKDKSKREEDLRKEITEKTELDLQAKEMEEARKREILKELARESNRRK